MGAIRDESILLKDDGALRCWWLFSIFRVNVYILCLQKVLCYSVKCGLKQVQTCHT